jgi:hypothetical protein
MGCGFWGASHFLSDLIDLGGCRPLAPRSEESLPRKSFAHRTHELDHHLFADDHSPSPAQRERTGVRVPQIGFRDKICFVPLLEIPRISSYPGQSHLTFLMQPRLPRSTWFHAVHTAPILLTLLMFLLGQCSEHHERTTTLEPHEPRLENPVFPCPPFLLLFSLS